MPSPYTAAKSTAATWFFLALLGMYTGFWIGRTYVWPLGVLISFVSLISAINNFGRLMRIWVLEDAERRADPRRGQPHSPRGFRGPGLPRKVFHLLFSVAEANGRAGAHERQLVQMFLMTRFLDPGLQREIQTWNARSLRAEQLGPLALELRRQLSPSECETMFFWCCLITLIDEKFSKSEHEMLQSIAANIGLGQEHARRVFHHAKAQVLEQRRPGDSQRGPRWGSRSTGSNGGSQRESRGSARSMPPSRERALGILGLEPTAQIAEIRKRHRELVKLHHPDAHNHLGEVARQEATERFREIQAAYELLTASA